MLRAKRGKILKYRNGDLEQAVEAVQGGESIRKASERFNVPKSTIGDRISGRFDISKPVQHGRPPAIPTEIESKIVSSVKMAAKLGVGLSRKEILLRTNVLCKRTKIKITYANFKAGKDWWEVVRRRHPELALRKPEKLSSVRARMMNESVVHSYFTDLEKVIQASEVTDAEIWNCDETGMNFEHTPVRVVAELGSTVVSKTSNKSSNITVMACINANGSSMPPLIITKGKTVKSLHGFNTKDAPKDTLWSFQEKGWITDDIGERWFNEVFLQHCGAKRPQVLVFDGHSSHESLAIIERAVEENITLISLPPHCTHYLQPLDRSVFGPFKKAYNAKCSEFLSEHPLHIVNKHTFPSLLTKAWNEAFTERNIKSGFASCGIWPLNRHAIPHDAYAPSIITDVPLVTPDASMTGASVAAANAMTDVPLEADNSMEGVQLDVANFVTDVPLEAANSMTESSEPVSWNVEQQTILDLSDPTQLLNLIMSGDLLVQDVGDTVNDVFLPPKIEGRHENKNKPKKTSHTILTSEDILSQKRDVQSKREEKEARRASKKLKKESK